MRLLQLITICGCAGLISCQPKPEEAKPEPRQPAVLDYTLLGIWPERYQAYEISNALGEAGIQSQLSGVRPCILNVETSKLERAQRAVLNNPEWQANRIR